jgi:anti-anti-sigma factor
MNLSAERNLTPQPFSCSTETEGDVAVVTPIGDLDIAGIDAFRSAVDRARAARLPGGVLVDLGGLTFLDSTGLTALLQLHRSCETSGGGLAMRRPHPDVLVVLELAGVDDRLPFVD